MGRSEADYDREASHIRRTREACPRAAAMELRLFEALSAHPGNHRLEVALVGLGACLDRGREIGDLEVEFYERLLLEAA